MGSFYEGNNLVANGVQMEAMSVEDRGEGIEFNVFCYNVQPGITIDYATGESHEDGTNTTASSASNNTSSSSTQTRQRLSKIHLRLPVQALLLS